MKEQLTQSQISILNVIRGDMNEIKQRYAVGEQTGEDVEAVETYRSIWEGIKAVFDTSGYMIDRLFQDVDDMA